MGQAAVGQAAVGQARRESGGSRLFWSQHKVSQASSAVSGDPDAEMLVSFSVKWEQ